MTYKTCLHVLGDYISHELSKIKLIFISYTLYYTRRECLKTPDTQSIPGSTGLKEMFFFRYKTGDVEVPKSHKHDVKHLIKGFDRQTGLHVATITAYIVQGNIVCKYSVYTQNNNSFHYIIIYIYIYVFTYTSTCLNPCLL